MVRSTTNYISLGAFKKSLQIDSTINDPKIMDVIASANSEVDSQLKPYLGDAPIDTKSSIYIQAKRVTMILARSLWYEKLGQLDRFDKADEIYQRKVEALVAAIKAERTDTTKTIIIGGKNQKDKKIFQSANKDEYMVRVFS